MNPLGATRVWGLARRTRATQGGDTEPQNHPVGVSELPQLGAHPSQPVDAAPLEMMSPEEETPSTGGEGDGDSGHVLLQALKSSSTRKVRNNCGVPWVAVGRPSTQVMICGAGDLVHGDGGLHGWGCKPILAIKPCWGWQVAGWGRVWCVMWGGNESVASQNHRVN